MTASLAGYFNLQSLTDAGALAVGGRLYTYTQGTTTQKNAYTDVAGAVAHTYTSDGIGGQYIALNARGELPAPLYLTSGAYDICLKTSAGATVWTRRADPTDALRGDLAAGSGSSLVGYEAAFGTVDTTVQAQLRSLFVTNKTIGATGDGVTNDTLALELGLINCKGTAIGNVLYLGPGTYCFSETTPNFGLYVDSPITIIGAGPSKTILKNTSATGAGLKCDGSWVNVRDLTIDNNGSTGVAFTLGGQYSTAENIRIINQAGSNYACVIDGTTLGVLRNVNITRCTNCISIGATQPTNYVRMEQVTLGPSSGVALNCNLGAGIRVAGLTIEPIVELSTSHGRLINITNSSDIEIANLTFEDAATSTLADNEYIKVDSSTGVAFKKARISHSGSASRSIFGLYGTAPGSNNISIEDVTYIETDANMILVQSVGNIAGLSVKNVNTYSTSACSVVTNTAVVTGQVIENIVSSNAASTLTLNAISSLCANTTGDIAVTLQDRQTFVNCSGAITGTGANQAARINSFVAVAGYKSPACNESADRQALGVNHSNASQTDSIVQITSATAAGAGFKHIYAASNGVNVFNVLGNGNVQNTNNSYGAISDIKLKENITPAPSYWDKFKQYQFVNYNLIADAENTKQLGVIAQQAEKVSGGVVYETPDYELTEVVNDEGVLEMVRTPTGTTTKAVKYSVITLQAEVVLQEAMKRIEDLESKVNKKSTKSPV